jgi:hypothetical protein
MTASKLTAHVSHDRKHRSSGLCGLVGEEFDDRGDLFADQNRNAKAARNPVSCAVFDRGKFGSLVTSTIQAGARPSSTRPGKPAPVQTPCLAGGAERLVSLRIVECHSVVDTSSPAESLR